MSWLTQTPDAICFQAETAAAMRLREACALMEQHREHDA